MNTHKHGYKHYQTKSDEFGTTEFYQRRVDTDYYTTEVCNCNDKLFVQVEVSTMDYMGIKQNSAEVYLIHENKRGEWCNLKVFCLEEEKLWEEIEKYELTLLSMWNIFCL